MTKRKSAQEIDAEAAEWAARLEGSPLTNDEEEAFRRWAESDARALGAFGRMRAIWLASEKAKALGPDFSMSLRDSVHPGGTSRRRAVGIGLAAAASVAVAWVGGVKLLSRGTQYVTGKGETRTVTLADNSIVTLNTKTKLVVGFTQAERRVNLSSGEALFDVAKNPARPFLVTAGDTLVRVVGTSFAVRHLESAPVQVLVREGIVEVSRLDSSMARGIRLTANTRGVALQGAPAVTAAAVTPAELQRELAWQEGRLAFEGQPLSEAAAEFARYSNVRIIIADPSLGKEEIAGLFRATDPVGFARTVAVSLNARLEIGENEVLLTR